MDDKDFLSGQLERVYYFMGKFRQNQSKRRFIKAPFDVVKLYNTTYVMPKSLTGVPVDDEGEVFNLSSHFFYDTKEDIVIEPNEMGDWKGNKDNWLQVHKFGLV